MEAVRLTSSVAHTIRREMSSQGITQLQLTKESGVPQVTLSRKLRALKPFSLNELGAICASLGTTPSQLMGQAESGQQAA